MNDLKNWFLKLHFLSKVGFFILVSLLFWLFVTQFVVTLIITLCSFAVICVCVFIADVVSKASS